MAETQVKTGTFWSIAGPILVTVVGVLLMLGVAQTTSWHDKMEVRVDNKVDKDLYARDRVEMREQLTRIETTLGAISERIPTQ